MSRRVRVQYLFRRLRRGFIGAAACGAALLLSANALFAQSGMCAGGTGTGTSTGTGTTTGSTGGVTASRSGGSTTSASSALGLLQLAQMGHQYQLMQEQAYQAQARQMMQLMQYESELAAEEQRQIEEYRAHRLANSQKRKALQAARMQELRNRRLAVDNSALASAKP